jgi:RND family efflux transporter MFP subunit
MNDVTQHRTQSNWHWLPIVVNLIVCVAILGAAVAAIIWINRTEPVAQKVNTMRKSAALVETITVRRGTYSPRLVVLGTVQAAQQINLRPRVSGQAIELKPEFVPGGMVKKGHLLLRIDPADFENAVSIRKSELEQAEASMEIEEARQQLAEKELKLLGNSIGDANRGLVMREPQIASMKAEVSAAKAAVERAELDLQRTEIYAPFDAQVLTRLVNVGSQVGPSDVLGQLIGLEQYWIMATVPVRNLRWVQFPNLEQSSQRISRSTIGSKVILRNTDAWGTETTREARVSKLIGTLDQQTRLARVLIIVDDPFGLKSNAPPLILDTLLQTEIEGRSIENVVRLDRDFVRDQDTVWLMKNEKLEIRKTEIVFQDAEFAYIQNGLEDGDEVVITTLATVAEGVGLRKIDEPRSNESAALKEPSNEADLAEEQAAK